MVPSSTFINEESITNKRNNNETIDCISNIYLRQHVSLSFYLAFSSIEYDDPTNDSMNINDIDEDFHYQQQLHQVYSFLQTKFVKLSCYIF